MDEKIRKSLLEDFETWRQKLKDAKDFNEAKVVMDGYKISADLILKYDMAVDSHDENIEKIDNAQAAEEKRIELEKEKLENQKAYEEKKIDLESNRLENDISASEERLRLEEERLAHERVEDEMKAKRESKWKQKEFWFNVGKGVITVGATVGVAIAAFYFDGKGVIFTSQAGKQVVPSVIKGLSNTLKL